MIKGIYLAAGSGKRFGSQKLLALFDGIPLFVYSLKSCILSELEEIVVVLGFNADTMKDEIRNYFSWTNKIEIVVNENYQNGLISSFNTGLITVGSDVDGVIMILADMPFIKSETVNKILNSRVPGKLIIPEANGRLTHPRIIPVELFNDFLKLGQVNSGKTVINGQKDSIVKVKFKDESLFRDFDTKIQLEKNKNS